MVTWISMSIAKFNRIAPDADPLNLITAAPENHLDHLRLLRFRVHFEVGEVKMQFYEILTWQPQCPRNKAHIIFLTVTWNSISIAKFNRSAPDADPLNLITAAPENHLDCPGSSHDTTQTHKGVSCAFWAERASCQSHFFKVLCWALYIVCHSVKSMLQTLIVTRIRSWACNFVNSVIHSTPA